MNQPFSFNPAAFGGTEYMARGWHKHIAAFVPKFRNYLSLLIPGNTPNEREMYESNKPIIVWLHNLIEQFDNDKQAILKHPQFLDNVKLFIVPSISHKNILLKELPLKDSQVYVIPNAIEPIEYDAQKYQNIKKLKLINTSGADRSLAILVNAIPKVDLDIEVNVFNDFYPDLQDSSKFDSRIVFYGKTPKATVRKFLSESHIHAYPSTFIETFCLSQIEAMSAGLLCLTSDYGSLPEVSKDYGVMYPYESNPQKHVETFAQHLAEAAETILSGKFDPADQIQYVNETYSWPAVKSKWQELHNTLL